MGRSVDDLLRVDLSAGTVERERVPADWRRKYLGGKGLGARYLYEELPPEADPLGSANVLLFMLGPLSGLLPGEQRYSAVTKSPLTGTFLDSYAGGTFPETLAGALDTHLGLLVTGRADEPVNLVVEDGTARIEPTDAWGADAVETCERFPDAAVACIGPGGEHRVAYATIASDRAEHHAGRGGAGAVMGAKRLKAVVARGDPPEPMGELAALRERAEAAFREADTGKWQVASGTLESVDFADYAGVLAARGWQERGFEATREIGIEAARAAAREREHDAPIPGGFRTETPEGDSVPRGATAMTLGAGLGLDEFDVVAELGERCNRLGVDLISVGNAVAWAIRATEAGLVTRDLAFGDPDGARALIEEIARRSSDLGDALADGVAAAAEQYGGSDFIPTVKDMALPSYDPRGAASMALAYATSDRGACHRRARPVEREPFEAPWGPAEVAAAVVEAQDARSVRWSLVADDFVGEAVAAEEWLDAAGYPHGDLARTGERIWNLTRLFAVREGFAREADALPDALDTNGALSEARFEAMLDAYYAMRGWSADGIPARGTLARLDLLATADDRTPVADAPLDPDTSTEHDPDTDP
ncbi:MAG: aldehyde ferredoxin oxidoreductase family protein [Haloferacaceae archaeon]